MSQNFLFSIHGKSLQIEIQSEIKAACLPDNLHRADDCKPQTIAGIINRISNLLQRCWSKVSGTGTQLFDHLITSR